MNRSGHHDPREEILEGVWILEEDGEPTLKALLKHMPEPGTGEALERLVGEGLLEHDAERLRLTPTGKQAAMHVVRANRLAARLLSDILELSEAVIERHACRLEHAINEELADSLCTLLGHPPTDPMGRGIPQGDCCLASRQTAMPAIRPLATLQLGHSAKVAFIHHREPSHMEPLSSFGLVPGTTVRIQQRQPLVIQVGESLLALDESIAQEIFVKSL